MTNQKPFKYFYEPVTFAVVLRNGHYVEVRVPSQDETDALTEGSTWFSGGRTYTISSATATALNTDGFTTVDKPAGWVPSGYGRESYGSGVYGV